MIDYSEKEKNAMLAKAHAQAYRDCMEELSSDMCISESALRFNYMTYFIKSILDMLAQSNGTTKESMSFTDLEKELIEAGIADEYIDTDDPSYLIVDLGYDTLQLEYDSFGRAILFHGYEYEVSVWNDETVRMITLIYKSLYDTAFLSNVEKCYEEYRREVIRQQMIETTGKGIIHGKLSGTDHKITESISCKDIVSCKIEMDSGSLKLESSIQELPNQIDFILSLEPAFL